MQSRLARDERAERVARDGQAAMDMLGSETWAWLEERLRYKLAAIEQKILSGGLAALDYEKECAKREALIAVLDVPVSAARTYRKLLDKENRHVASPSR